MLIRVHSHSDKRSTCGFVVSDLSLLHAGMVASHSDLFVAFMMCASVRACVCVCVPFLLQKMRPAANGHKLIALSLTVWLA